MHLLKSCVGSGILSLPIAFQTAGLWGGSILFPLVALMAIHSMHLLCFAERGLARRYSNIYLDLFRLNSFTHRITDFTFPFLFTFRHDVSHLTYSQVADLAFRGGPKIVRPLAPLARFDLIHFSFFILLMIININK